MNPMLMQLKSTICSEIVGTLDFGRELTEEEIFDGIDDVLVKHPERRQLSVDELLKLRTEIFFSLKRFDVLQEYLDDEEVTEIMINGKDHIFVERHGHLYETGKCFESVEKLEDIIQQMVAGCNRSVNEASPIADARLPGGERVNIVLAPVALNGPIVTIRRFPKEPITMQRLISMGSVTDEAAAFLKQLVLAKYNIMISGGTGSGKTTFLNALSQFIPSDERIITIEDSAELQLLGADNLVRLETRTANSDNCKEITIRDLIRSALRMRPERVIVGEVRGEEALDMLQAMNTGHDGSLSTGHANSAKDMLKRLETMVLCAADFPLSAIRGQIAGGVDIIVHLGRVRDKSRKVLEISEVVGMESGEIVLSKLFEYDGVELKKVNELIHQNKLIRNLEV